MDDIEYIAEELDYDIVNHSFDEVCDPERLKEIILNKLKQLKDE